MLMPKCQQVWTYGNLYGQAECMLFVTKVGCYMGTLVNSSAYAVYGQGSMSNEHATLVILNWVQSMSTLLRSVGNVCCCLNWSLG